MESPANKKVFDYTLHPNRGRERWLPPAISVVFDYTLHPNPYTLFFALCETQAGLTT